MVLQMTEILMTPVKEIKAKIISGTEQKHLCDKY